MVECKEIGNKPEVVTTCKIVLKMEKRNQNFLKRLMPINSYMELAKSGEIKDPELKNAVERLIRAIG